jgi:hypothetical protein
LKEAEELQFQVMQARKRVIGAEHPDTLLTMGHLGRTYSHQGRWKEAEELELQVLEARKRLLGDKHPDTLLALDNLTLTQGMLQEAKEVRELGHLTMTGGSKNDEPKEQQLEGTLNEL